MALELPITDIFDGRWASWPLPAKDWLLQALQGIEPPLPLLDWVIQNRPMLIPDRPVDFVSHPFLVDPYRDTAREMVIYKASQLGASELLISYALHACDQRDCTVLYVFPTDTHVSDFSSARIGPAIEASAYLQEIVKDGLGRSSRGADRVKLKRVGNRFLYLRGSQVSPSGDAPQLKAVDADVLILDEVDEMDGRAPAIARKRLGHSQIREVRAASTPTYHEVGIHQLWQETDQREWFVHCSHCGHHQALTIDHFVTDWDQLRRPSAWHGDLEAGEIWAACERCGQRLDRLGPGEWVAAHPGRAKHGYHLMKLFSPLADMAKIVISLQSLDPTVLKETWNQDLGLPYTPAGGQLTAELLDAACRQYIHGPVARERTVMGVDVGKLLNVVIRGPADRETGESPQRFAGEVAAFDDVGHLMRLYSVQVCCVDALPETREARRFQSSWPPGRVWLAYYVVQKTGSKKEDAIQVNEEEWVVNLDRTRILDDMMARIVGGTFTLPAIGRGIHVIGATFTLPANGRSITNYYSQMRAIVRVLEEHRGQKVAVYISTGADHFAHAEAYCLVAGNLPGPAPLPSQHRLETESRWE
jgi:hypothetical protein